MLREPYRGQWPSLPGKDKISTNVPNAGILNDGYLHAVVDMARLFQPHALLYVRELDQRDLAVQRVVKVQTAYANDALAFSKRRKSIWRKTAIANEQAASPSGLLLDFSLKYVKVGCSGGGTMSLSLQQISLVSEQA